MAQRGVRKRRKTRPGRKEVLVVGLRYTAVGGIERLLRKYVEALQLSGYSTKVVSLDSGAVLGRNRLSLALRAVISAMSRRPNMILVGHLRLLPIVPWMKRAAPASSVVLLVYGQEVWRGPSKASSRRRLASVDAVWSISSFTGVAYKTLWNPDADPAIIAPPSPIRKSEKPVARSRAESAPTTGHAVTEVLTVSRLDARERTKNVDVLIKAVGLLRDDRLPIRLTVVGDGTDRERLEALADSHAPGAVSFQGSVADSELDDSYRSADIFCLPSVQEGFGIVFLEALAHGLPVVAAAATAVPEVVTPEVGVLVVPSPATVADAIRKLATDSDLRHAMSEAAIRRAETFSFDMFMAAVGEAAADAIECRRLDGCNAI